MTLTPVARRIMLGGIIVLFGVVGWLTWTMPPVLQLGTLVRLVIFHGASTWVNMAAFTLAGLAGLAYLTTSRDPLYRVGSAFRYIAVPWWIINTGLGLLSSRLAWNGINLAEPRLQATFWIMLAAGIVLAVDFGFGKRRWSAAADVAVAAVLWTLILGARNFVHPDNPVMNSGPEIQLPFFGIVGSLLAATLLAAAMIFSMIPAEEQ
ncbi:MAG: hypothetical protein IBX63_03210 [Coriobacteriia bacterium]|nr:hypothetical protein [Coriobacteriia bacterium]